MKALLIISSLPDIIFIHADKGFVKHINKLSREAGFIGEDHNEDEMDTTALSQIFSPMITSLTYMNELGNPYSSILCEDGTLFVFRQVSVRIGSIFAILWVLHRRELGRNTVVCYTAVFSVVTQRSSPLTAAENRTTFLSLD